MNNKELALIANDIRKDIIRMLTEAKSGHTAGSLGMAEIFTVLYHNHAHVDPHNPKSPKRDYIFLSNGHICPVWYSTLASKGFFTRDYLWGFRKINSLLQGHPHNTTIPGVENSGGPLGQGISQACGAALALKRTHMHNRVFCLTGDGELDEGQAWEGFMFAGHYKLDNLTIIVDRNNIQIDNYTNIVMDLEPLADKFKAFNFNVQIIDGHDLKAIKKALVKADKYKGKPSVIIAMTIPGKGYSEFENKYEWHGKPPTEELARKAFEELDEERKRIMSRGWLR